MILATAFILVYLSGEFLVFKRFSPVDLTDVVEAVSSSGTIALISFFVGLEVAAAFILIVGELLEQTLLIRHGSG